MKLNLELSLMISATLLLILTTPSKAEKDSKDAKAEKKVKITDDDNNPPLDNNDASLKTEKKVKITDDDNNPPLDNNDASLKTEKKVKITDDDNNPPLDNNDASLKTGKVGESGNIHTGREEAGELQAKIQAIHKNDPLDSMQLAQRTLLNAFKLFNSNQTGIKLTKIFQAINQTPGKSLLFILRLFDLMDANNDYVITDNEFTTFFVSPLASPHRLLELMFDIQDLDGDGNINKYEFLETEMLDLGVNYNLHDMWRAVSSAVASMDVSDDEVIDGPEYVNFVIYEINKGIVQQRFQAMEKAS